MGDNFALIMDTHNMIRQHDIRRATLRQEANQYWSSVVFSECMATGMLAAACILIGMNPYASLALAALVGFLVLSSARARRLIGWVSTALYTLMGAYAGYACESWALGIILSIFVFLLSSGLDDMGNQHYDDLQSRSLSDGRANRHAFPLPFAGVPSAMAGNNG